MACFGKIVLPPQWETQSRAICSSSNAPLFRICSRINLSNNLFSSAVENGKIGRIRHVFSQRKGRPIEYFDSNLGSSSFKFSSSSCRSWWPRWSIASPSSFECKAVTPSRSVVLLNQMNSASLDRREIDDCEAQAFAIDQQAKCRHALSLEIQQLVAVTRGYCCSDV